MPIDQSYNDVAARMREFFAKYPEGSLQRVGDVQVVAVDGVSFLLYTAAAYRSPEDPLPGHGTAWERVPGLTNFTRNSEAQNCETSAWGRAILAVGAADTKKGIASRDEIESRQAEDAYYQSDEYAEMQAVPGLRSSIEGAIAKLDDAGKDALKAWFAENRLPAVRRCNAHQCDAILDHLLTFDGGGGTASSSSVLPSPDGDPT